MLPLLTEPPEPNQKAQSTSERDYSGKTRTQAKEKAKPPQQQQQPSSSKSPAKHASSTSAVPSNSIPTSAAPQQQPKTTSNTAIPTTTQNSMTEKAAPVAAKKNPPSRPRVRPQQGKAATECGCFGNLHEALTNCLYCGRVACQEEGYTFCPFCGYQLAPVEPPVDGNAYVPCSWRGCLLHSFLLPLSPIHRFNHCFLYI